MRHRDVELLVWIDQDPAPKQLDRPAQVEVLVRGEEVLPAAQRLPAREPHAEHRILPRRLRGEPVPRADLRNLPAQPPADLVEVVVGPRPAQQVERGQAGGRADRVAAQRPARPHQVPAVGPVGVEGLHDPVRAGDGRHRKPAGHRLAVGGQIRGDAVPLLGPSPGDPEAGDDLIEDQHDIVPSGRLAERFEEPGHRGQHALERLHDHPGQLSGVTVDDLDRPRGVVERGHQHLPAQDRRDAERVRLRVGVGARSGRHGTPERVVAHPVPAALELEDLVPTRRRPG